MNTIIKDATLYPVTVDYKMSVEEFIELDHYEWVDEDITSKNFPTSKRGKADIIIELFHFDGAIPCEKNLQELRDKGYRLVELQELLAFGKNYPDVQRQFQIIALGSEWHNSLGLCCNPYLSGDGLGRFLFLAQRKNLYFKSCRFAAVHK